MKLSEILKAKINEQSPAEKIPSQEISITLPVQTFVGIALEAEAWEEHAELKNRPKDKP